MRVFRFRVLCDENDEFYRDFDLTSEHTLFDFHQAIQKELSFDPSQMACFFTCNQEWEKEQEFILFEVEDDLESSTIVMDVALLTEFITEPRQRLIYVYDQIEDRQLFIELIDNPEYNSKRKYPVCVDREGDAPEQNMDEDFSQIEEGSGKEFNYYDDEYLNELDPEEGFSFENIDDYDL